MKSESTRIPLLLAETSAVTEAKRYSIESNDRSNKHPKQLQTQPSTDCFSHFHPKTPVNKRLLSFGYSCIIFQYWYLSVAAQPTIIAASAKKEPTASVDRPVTP